MFVADPDNIETLNLRPMRIPSPHETTSIPHNHPRLRGETSLPRVVTTWPPSEPKSFVESVALISDSPFIGTHSTSMIRTLVTTDMGLSALSSVPHLKRDGQRTNPIVQTICDQGIPLW